jgi:hypothetical protein
MGDKICTLSIFLNDRKGTDDRFRVQVSCSGPGLSGWSYKDYDQTKITRIAWNINKILGGQVKELNDYDIRDNIKIPITIENSNQIRKELDLTFIIKGGSRRARGPSRKYKKSAKRVFRKKSRSTRRR